MKPKMSIVTLGVTNHIKSRDFYEKGLGFPLSNQINDRVSFFELEGTWLGLFDKKELAKDAIVSEEGSGFGGITLAHNVASKDEVHTIIELARKAGAVITKEPQDVFWGEKAWGAFARGCPLFF